MQPRWRPEEIRSKELNLTVESVSAEELRLRLKGSTLLDRTKGNFKYSFEAELEGILVYDRKKGVLSRSMIRRAIFTRRRRAGRMVISIAVSRSFLSPGAIAASKPLKGSAADRSTAS